jgi:hypothetical protein
VAELRGMPIVKVPVLEGQEVRVEEPEHEPVIIRIPSPETGPTKPIKSMVVSRGTRVLVDHEVKFTFSERTTIEVHKVRSLEES